MALTPGPQLWTIALLIFMVVIPLLALYAVGSGLVDLDWPLAQVATIVLAIALGLFALVLVLGGERLGYLAAVVAGVIPVVGVTANIRLIARGERPAALLITNVPSVVFALALIYVALLGWMG